MHAVSNPKYQEAQEHVKAAEKALTTSFFKRKPDYDTAASEYESAATTFRYVKAFEECLKATLSASDCQYKSESIYMAAKSMESAGQVAVQHLKRTEEGVKFYQRACQLYQQNNNIDRAIEVLEKAAKLLEPIQLEQALPLYEDACGLYDDEDKGMMAVETYKKTISVHLKLKQLEKAIARSLRLNDILIKIQNKHLLHKNQLSLVILYLAMGDEVAANKQFQSADTFLQSDEGDIAHALLVAFEKQNQNDVKETVKRQQVGFLDNEVVKVARTLKVMGAELEPSSAEVNLNKSTALCDDVEKPKADLSKEETNDLC